MPLEETIYSTSQISIPAELPDLLKQYTKAAIRTQPPDILQWYEFFKGGALTLHNPRNHNFL